MSLNNSQMVLMETFCSKNSAGLGLGQGPATLYSPTQTGQQAGPVWKVRAGETTAAGWSPSSSVATFPYYLLYERP